MSTDLLENITSQLAPPMVQKVSTFLGETAEHTQAAVNGAIPTILAGLMHFSSLANGPVQLLALINRDNYGRLLNNLSGLGGEGNTTQNVMTSGQEILRVVFADKLDNASERVAAASGVSNASASSLLSLTAPVVVGVLGRLRAVQGLNAARLITLLMGQKAAITKSAPAGLAGVFGVSDLLHLGPPATETKSTPISEPVRRMVINPPGDKNPLKQWGWPILGVVAIGLIYFFLS